MAERDPHTPYKLRFRTQWIRPYDDPDTWHRPFRGPVSREMPGTLCGRGATGVCGTTTDDPPETHSVCSKCVRLPERDQNTEGRKADTTLTSAAFKSASEHGWLDATKEEADGFIAGYRVGHRAALEQAGRALDEEWARHDETTKLLHAVQRALEQEREKVARLERIERAVRAFPTFNREPTFAVHGSEPVVILHVAQRHINDVVTALASSPGDPATETETSG